MLRLASLLLVLMANMGHGAPLPKEVKRGVVLEGTWEVHEFYTQGQMNSSYDGALWKFSKDSINIEYPAATGLAAMCNKINSVEITPTSNNLDYTNSTGIDRKCIFEIHADTLTLCIPLTPKRPGELKAGPENILYKFKRVKE